MESAVKVVGRCVQKSEIAAIHRSKQMAEARCRGVEVSVGALRSEEKYARIIITR